MYAVKSSGRNGVKSYSPEMTMESRRRWAIETDLHKAIERQELVLYFQPQVDVRTGRLVGAEALMRWNRGGQLVPPNDFIGIAQECGLIIPMGEWAV
jgi:EAL domain-containing protein (putative c-di-GMP-specific phosphodiesterase class I)